MNLLKKYWWVLLVATLLAVSFARNAYLAEERVRLESEVKVLEEARLGEFDCIKKVEDRFLTGFNVLCKAEAKTEEAKDACVTSIELARSYSGYRASLDPNDPFARLLDRYEDDNAKCNK